MKNKLFTFILLATHLSANTITDTAGRETFTDEVDFSVLDGDIK